MTEKHVGAMCQRLSSMYLWYTPENVLVHVSYGGNPPSPLPAYVQSIYDPLKTLTYIAAKTERIILGTSVICAFFHVLVELARRFATLDQFSQGCVLAGLGQVWLQEAFETANIPLRRRGQGIFDLVALPVEQQLRLLEPLRHLTDL